MFVDLIGKIKNTSLPKSHALFPLFEAVINSFQSIEYLDNKSNSYIKITLEKNKDIESNPVKNIIIEDNGIGFNNSNFKSFNTAYSSYKSLKGCKGVGRFKWLKAFENVKIESCYMENKTFFKRVFTFNLLSENCINELINDKCNESTFKTVVLLENSKEEYLNYFPCDLNEIALRIIEHCLPYFIYRKNISVTISDGETVVNLNEMFNKNIKLSNNIFKFSIQDNDFEILHCIETSKKEKANLLSICANNREVKAYELSKYIKDLSSKIKSETVEEFYYHGYIYSNILDKHVNNSRTDFNMDEEGISEEIIINETVKIIKSYLKKYIDPISSSKEQRIYKYINEKSPQYKPLIKYKRDWFNELSNDLTDEKLELSLYKLFQDFNLEMKEKSDKILNKNICDMDKIAEYKKEYDDFLEKENLVLKSSLVKYIAHRKIILTLFKNALTINKDGDYPIEEYVHKIIFPMKNRFNEITYDNHNLWIIDEKLTFYSYLNCSNPYTKQKGLDKSENLLVINNPISLIDEDEKPYSSLSILYFNKPMRTNYANLNPIDEIQKYIINLRNKKELDRSGRIITLTDDAIINVYMLCDLNYELLEIIENRDFQHSEDKLEYTLFHRNLNAFIKIISYDKILKEANARNKILFDKLFFTEIK